MNEIKILNKNEWPQNLLEIPDAPEKLSYCGEKPKLDSVFLTVVGSRKYSPYGKETCEKIISGLKGYDITIVSGLALGIDSIAHKSALANNLKTISVPGSGLKQEVLYPRSNFNLAQDIIKSGSCLLSEFEDNQGVAQWTFPQRNRIMAALSKVTLVIEASEKSGTLITAHLALDYNRELAVIPTSIFSFYGKGSNNLLNQGATAINTSQDLLQILGFDLADRRETLSLNFENCSDEEKIVLEKLKEAKEKDNLIAELNMSATQINIILSSLEIKGLIKESLGKIHLNVD